MTESTTPGTTDVAANDPSPRWARLAPQPELVAPTGVRALGAAVGFFLAGAAIVGIYVISALPAIEAVVNLRFALTGGGMLTEPLAVAIAGDGGPRRRGDDGAGGSARAPSPESAGQASGWDSGPTS
jgi:hypothetical protein